MMTQQRLVDRVAALHPDLSLQDVSLAVELHQKLCPTDPKPIETIRLIARQFERRAELAQRAFEEELRREARAELGRPERIKATSTATVAVDLAPLGNIVSREWGKKKRPSVEQARLELWGHTSAIAVTPASALKWQEEAASATVQLLTAKATTLAADAGGTVSVWETYILTDALPYNSAMEIEVSRDRVSLHFRPGATLKQAETILQSNREVFGLLPKRSQPIDKDDDCFLDVVERLGGPPAEGEKEAWWGNVFIPRWNAAALKPRYDEWRKPYQRYKRLMEKLRPCLP